MTKMTIWWLAVYTFCVTGSFLNPAFGTLAYLFEYYLRPSLHWWGLPLPDLRWNLVTSVVLTLTFVARRAGLAKIVDANRAPGTILLLFAALMILVTFTVAVDPAYSWVSTTNYLKLILFHGLIVGTIRSIGWFDAFVAMHLFGAGWWGWEVFQNPRREQSRLYGVGSGDSLGDNKAAVHLLSVTPLMITYALMAKDKYVRGIAAVATPLVINTLILCNSRGGMVGFVTASALSFFVIRPGHRIRAAGAGLLVVAAFYFLADPEFIQRQQTTANYQEDGSAMGRLESWEGGLQLISDYPLGAGGGGYRRLSPIYIREIVLDHDGQERAPHNTFVLVASEWGLIGLGLYVAYYAACIRLLIQVRRTNPDGGFWYYRSVAVQTALVGVFVGGTFTDRFYSESPFWMGGLAVALHRLNEDRLAKAKAVSGEVPSEASSDLASGLHPAAARIAGAHAGGA